MRYDLAFLLFCCRSFLGDHETDKGQDFYAILQVDRDATQDEIKRAYKRLSLQLHPDKLAQRGQQITEEDQYNFTRMKEAYEVLSDPHKRETYNAIGERGMKWLDEPFSIDPQELVHNFAKSSVLDRAKIFAIFVAIAVAILLLPILVCLHLDGTFGNDASWMCTLVPLWVWNCFILFYHSRVIMMGPIHRPDNIPEEQWVDPLPMSKRIMSLLRFVLIIGFEVLVALRLDHIVSCSWAVVFVPFFIWELTTIFRKWPVSQLRVVTVQDLEIALGKHFQDFTPAERELISKRYSVVQSVESPEFEAAQKMKSRARHDMVVSIFRICFAAFLVAQIETGMNWNWWIVFSPFWILSGLLCCANLQAYAEVQQMAAERDPNLFNDNTNNDVEATTDASNNATHEGSTNYGSVGYDGDATQAEASKSQGASSGASATTPLTEEEREELRAQVLQSGSKLCTKCCSQGFTLILIVMFISKLQGADFSTLWIISPFLFGASIILCCLGCAIFGITEVNASDIEFDTADANRETVDTHSQQQQQPHIAPLGTHYAPPSSTDNDSSTNSALTEPPADIESTGSTSAEHQPAQTQQQQQQPVVDLLDSGFTPAAATTTNNLEDLD